MGAKSRFELRRQISLHLETLSAPKLISVGHWIDECLRRQPRVWRIVRYDYSRPVILGWNPNV
jgi:hypothetical protein